MQDRALQARELNAQKQKELLFKRVAAIQEVLAAARPLVKALKDERKARVSAPCRDSPSGYNSGWERGVKGWLAAAWLLVKVPENECKARVRLSGREQQQSG